MSRAATQSAREKNAVCGRNVRRRERREKRLGIEGIGPPEVLKETSWGNGR